jgi:hypothetical protein
MKTSILARALALISAAATTMALVLSLALYGLPAADTASQFAQADVASAAK